MFIPSSSLNLVNGDLADLSHLFRRAESFQTCNGCLDHVGGVVGAQALRTNVGNTGSLQHRSDLTAGDDTGTLGSRLQKNLTGAKDTNDLVVNMNELYYPF